MTIAALLPSSWDLTINSWNLASRLTGRLSTQKKPRSSRARRKVPFPEPLRPVMMTKEDACIREKPENKKPEARRQKPEGGTAPIWLSLSPFWLLASGFWLLVSRLCFGLDPSDIAVLPFVDNVEPLGNRISEDQKIVVGIADLDRGIIDTHGLRRHFMGPDDPWQPFPE